MYRFSNILRKVKIMMRFDVNFSSRKNHSGVIRRDFFGTLEILVGLLVTALPGEQSRQFDELADLLRSQFNGLAQMGFSFVCVLALFGEFGLRQLSFGGADFSHLLSDRFGLIEPPAKKARSIQVILEQIALSFQIGTGFNCTDFSRNWRALEACTGAVKGTGGLGAASPGAAQPKRIFGVGGLQWQRLFRSASVACL